jgi:hypothetical protein
MDLTEQQVKTGASFDTSQLSAQLRVQQQQQQCAGGEACGWLRQQQVLLLAVQQERQLGLFGRWGVGRRGWCGTSSVYHVLSMGNSD